jgi:hypothetical protein
MLCVYLIVVLLAIRNSLFCQYVLFLVLSVHVYIYLFSIYVEVATVSNLFFKSKRDSLEKF